MHSLKPFRNNFMSSRICRNLRRRATSLRKESTEKNEKGKYLKQKLENYLDKVVIKVVVALIEPETGRRLAWRRR
jgi:hypothetical protein